jgi:hypothetical protein
VLDFPVDLAWAGLKSVVMSRAGTQSHAAIDSAAASVVIGDLLLKLDNGFCKWRRKL